MPGRHGDSNETTRTIMACETTTFRVVVFLFIFMDVGPSASVGATVWDSGRQSLQAFTGTTRQHGFI